MDWAAVFDDFTREPGATTEALASLRAELAAPPSPDEIDAINAGQQNPFPATDPLHAVYEPFDPQPWRLPNVPLPASYLELLRWSDGGWFRRGERELGFFGAADLRSMAFAHHVPEYMPGAIPIGLDGGGVFAMFDARGGPAAEYPIVVIGAGNLDYDDAVVVAETFEALCRGDTALGELYSPDPEGPSPGRRVAVILIDAPDDVKTLARIRRLLHLDRPLGELRRDAANATRDAPLLLTDALSFALTERALEPLEAHPPWLAIVDCEDD